MINKRSKMKIEKEIEGRIKEMEDPAYDFGPPLNRYDVFGMFFVAVICVLGIIWGIN